MVIQYPQHSGFYLEPMESTVLAVLQVYDLLITFSEGMDCCNTLEGKQWVYVKGKSCYTSRGVQETSMQGSAETKMLKQFPSCFIPS